MNEKSFEKASELELAMRNEGLYAAALALSSTGQADCADCGKPIPAARRQALPSAMRCTLCQSAHEPRRA